MLQKPTFTEAVYSSFPNSPNSWNTNIAIPCNCPHCGLIVAPKIVATSHANISNGRYLCIVVAQCNHCRKLYSSFYDREPKGTYTLISIYPSPRFYVPSPVIQETSPRFVDLYEQVLACEQRGDYDLAAIGSRTALEVLIKDFAIKELGKSEEEVVGKKLQGAIDAYLPDSAFVNAADVVRILGNDHVHYQRKYDQFGYEEVRYYLHIFLQLIEIRLMAAHPPIHRP